MPQQLNITAGPGKFDLMLSLFDSTSSNPHPVRFGVSQGSRKGHITVHVVSVEKEDGSGESWNIKGYCQGKPVEIYFSTKTRKGVINR